MYAIIYYFAFDYVTFGYTEMNIVYPFLCENMNEFIYIQRHKKYTSLTMLNPF